MNERIEWQRMNDWIVKKNLDEWLSWQAYGC